MTVKIARNGEVELAYETFGDPSGEPLLLIMGLGHQMLLWPDGFCEALAEAGFHVARFDNRDSGLSTYFDRPDDQKWWQALLGQGKPPYTSDAFVADALAVMDALGWPSAHVAGSSIGRLPEAVVPPAASATPAPCPPAHKLASSRWAAPSARCWRCRTRTGCAVSRPS